MTEISQPNPDAEANQGPRLNPFTDAETDRHQAELERANAEQAERLAKGWDDREGNVAIEAAQENRKTAAIHHERAAAYDDRANRAEIVGGGETPTP